MKEEFNWETAEYPCFGIADEEVVCFSAYKVGHVSKNENAHRVVGYGSTSWNMERFKPYTPPKPKTKLWYFEYYTSGCWYKYNKRITEHTASNSFTEYRKLETDGFIEIEE